MANSVKAASTAKAPSGKPVDSRLVDRLRSIVGADGVLSNHSELMIQRAEKSATMYMFTACVYPD